MLSSACPSFFILVAPLEIQPVPVIALPPFCCPAPWKHSYDYMPKKILFLILFIFIIIIDIVIAVNEGWRDGGYNNFYVSQVLTSPRCEKVRSVLFL